MDMTGERRIPAPRQTVWEALNNTDVLKASIPGCESLEKLDNDQMKATAAIKVGPISARFNGKVQLSDINAPTSYRISGEGQGGVAGFAKGGADVNLADDGADTLLSYKVNAQVGGKLAQLGGRLIDATAKQMADAFFDRFSKQVQAMAPAEAVAAESNVAEPTVAKSGVAASNVAEPNAASEPAMAQAGNGQAGRINVVRPAARKTETEAQANKAAAQADVRQTAAEDTARNTMAEPVAAALGAVNPPAAISMWSLIPREPFGLPLVAWIGSGVFAIMVLLMLVSML